MGKIVRDERYMNTIWCLCNNYKEYLQFAKDLFLLTGIENCFSGAIDNDERWIDDSLVWSETFDVDLIIGEDEGSYWEEAVDPINDTYEINEKPKEDEYPVVVHYDNYNKNILWMSLNKLRES